MPVTPTPAQSVATVLDSMRNAGRATLRRCQMDGLARDVAARWTGRGIRPERGQMSLSDARRAFGEPLVRVRLDWDALEAMDAPVMAHVYSTNDDLSRLVHPWCTDSHGQETGWDVRDARPLSVAEVAAQPTFGITRTRRAAVDRIAREMARWDPPVQVTAFGYELPNGKQLILDSNHRIAALAKLAGEGTPFRLIVLGVKGPLDGAILPDLMHHARDRKPLMRAVERAEQRRASEMTAGLAG